jgi:hypothetical protein
MTAFAEVTAERAEAIAEFARLAGALGLPLNTHLVVFVGGSTQTAQGFLDKITATLDHAGITFTRDDTARRQAVIVPIGAGVTYRVVHTSTEPRELA